jgi:hypothetical protein
MMRLFGRHGVGPDVPVVAPVALSPEEMLYRLPRSARESVTSDWPFADMRLDDPAPSGTSVNQLRHAADGILRVTGVATIAPRVDELQLRVAPDTDSRDFLWVILHTPDARRYRQLAGLLMDVSVMPDVQPGTPLERLCVREGLLTAMHGIQAPLQSGDEQGVARGIVRELESAPYSREPHGMQLDTGGDAPVNVQWHAVRAPDLRDAGVLELGSVIALDVQRTGGPLQYRTGRAADAYPLEPPQLLE